MKIITPKRKVVLAKECKSGFLYEKVGLKGSLYTPVVPCTAVNTSVQENGSSTARHSIHFVSFQEQPKTNQVQGCLLNLNQEMYEAGELILSLENIN